MRLMNPVKPAIGVCVALLALVLLVSTVSCKPESGDSGKLRVGLMPKLIGIDFFNACERGAREAANELGVELVYDGPTAADVTKQAEMLDTWITRRLDVIAVAPNDPNALAPTLKRARAAGIKVLTWDADSNPADSRDYFVNQATPESMGFGLVDLMARLLKEKGKVAIITGSLTAANQNIWIGFMKQRLPKYPDLELVTILPSEENQSLAFRVAQDLLKSYPDIDGIWGLTSVSLPGTAEAVRQAGKSGKIVVTGLSTPKQMSQYVHDGTVDEFMLFSPVDLGYLSVQVAKLVIDQGSLGPTIAAGRLGTITVSDQTVLLGDPMLFNIDNVDNFDF